MFEWLDEVLNDGVDTEPDPPIYQRWCKYAFQLGRPKKQIHENDIRNMKSTGAAGNDCAFQQTTEKSCRTQMASSD